jgi:hypothetical protein
MPGVGKKQFGTPGKYTAKDRQDAAAARQALKKKRNKRMPKK